MLSQRALLRAAPRFVRTPAARTTVRSRFYSEVKLEGNADNAFNRERLAVKHHAAATSGLWRKLSIYMVIPALAIAGANAYKLWVEHWEHVAHAPPKSELPEYSYQNIRTKNFWYGTGDKTWFWNDKVNYHKNAPEE
ncbi:putative cytochrome c oxidase subunit VIa [Lophium mytilinum]|uniref:Cytochrome c oxidase subunit 13, mitochondrial n=1 Tax=Lophium mytilinum TaxID=390894 RepID=A0A6A6QAA3_9PEZI|nr:putative cytochrome c oxidase subunit VIa [Lophium mytilinum]